MKKFFTLLLTASLIFISTYNYSQDRETFYGLGVDAALPIGDLTNVSSFGIGITAKGLWAIGNGGSMIGVNLGIMNFIPKSEYISSVNMIPLYVDFRQYFGDFFVEPMLGISITPYKKGPFDDESDAKHLVGIGWSVGAGYTLNEKFDFSLRFEASHNQIMRAFLALRVGYNF